MDTSFLKPDVDLEDQDEEVEIHPLTTFGGALLSTLAIIAGGVVGVMVANRIMGGK